MITVDKLKEILNCTEDQHLAKRLGRTKGAVSVWRKKGVPAIVEREVMRMIEQHMETTGQGNGKNEVMLLREPETGYAQIDPVDKAFLDDWHNLTDVEQMRIWTLVREARARMKAEP